MARILIVDDDFDTVDSYVMMLKEWGHETRRAYDGESVLQQALAFSPQLVLLDIGLPGIDGFEVVRRLRQYQQLVGTKMIAVTGRATDLDPQSWKAAGFDEFFLKPMVPERLKALVKSIE